MTAPTRQRRDAANNVRRRLRREQARVIRDAERAVETAAIVRAATRRPREVRAVSIGGRRVQLGAFAGTAITHPFVPDEHTGTSCMGCFGWSNDVRHWPCGEGGNRG